MFIKMLKKFADKAANEIYDVDDATANEWIEAGLCEENKTEIKSLKDELKEALDAHDEIIVKNITKSVASEIKTAIPAQVKSEDKPEENFFVCVGKAASNNPEVREKAYNVLKNKYNSERKDYTGMAQGTTTAGGFLVPADYINNLLSVDGYDSLFYNKVNLIPTQARTVYLPALDQTGTPGSGTSAFYGSVVMAITAEGVTPSTVKPAFLQVSLTGKKMMGLTEISNELIEMSPISVEKLVSDNFRKAFLNFFDYQVIRGAGSASSFYGITDHAATCSIKRKTANKVDVADLGNMWAAMSPQGKKRAIWVINPAVWGQLPIAGSAANQFVFLGNNSAGPLDLRIFGRPLYDHEFCQGLGSSGDVMLVDPSAYCVSQSREVRINASPHVEFTNDVTVYRCTAIMDGKPQLTAPIKIGATSATEVSPFVQLSSSVAS